MKDYKVKVQKSPSLYTLDDCLKDAIESNKEVFDQAMIYDIQVNPLIVKLPGPQEEVSSLEEEAKIDVFAMEIIVFYLHSKAREPGKMSKLQLY